ncbi:MAG: undecaprenyl-diphosphate phosphatase [Ruminococcaceae bacterium]|nr:undecaprenyl-diphosphate phosphatase [Oscillospiraceae bacterium]
MVDFIQMLKVFFLGIVEGITEWLPISSTGHLILVDEFLQLSHPNNPAFKDMFIDVIQLGAILAVVLVFFKDLWPFGLSNDKKPTLKMPTLSMWGKIIVACIPGAVAAFAFNDFIEANLSSPYIIAAALIVYGIAFILIENLNKKRTPKVDSIEDISYTKALLIGLFQVLSIIPGTSRSGSTIIGGLLLGISRKAAAQFTFFLAVPVMFGLSALKLLKYILEFGFGFADFALLGFGMLVAFAVSLFVIKFLMSYIRKHDFKVFGWYRIVLGAIVIAYFAFIG